MSVHGRTLRRRANELPAELVRVNSDLDVFITIASSSADRKTFGFRSNLEVAREMIAGNCHQYQASEAFETSLMCNSGEDDGQPRRDSACYVCRVGQFSRSGSFIGEMTSDRYPHVPHGVIQSGSEALSYLIKAHEESR